MKPGRRPLLLAALLAAGGALADDDGHIEFKETEWLLEVSPYYSSIGALIPIDNSLPLVAGGEMKEEDVYRTLFVNSGSPNVLLLEASVYPMPWLGTELRENSPGLYGRDARRLSLIPALTAGFQEPWAVSVFLGNDLVFARPGQPKKETNRGFMGYLVTYGNKHITNNRMVDDDWFEFEWKMKGERIFDEDRLSWSFRVGARFHSHDDVGNTVYLGISRSNLDFNAPILSWLHNTKINLLTEFLQDGGQLSRQEVVLGKKIPVKNPLFAAWQIEAGVIYDNRNKYTGSLAQQAARGATFVLRPNIEF